MKKIVLLLLVSLLVLSGCAQDTGKETPASKFRIGVIQLADHPALDAAYEGMIEELDTLIGKDKYEVIFKNAQGKLTEAELIAEQFVDDKLDLIYAIATNAAQAAANKSKGTDIPVVFNAVTDPIAAELVASMENSGNNITGVSDISPIDRQLAIVTEVLPDAKKVGVLYNIGEVNSKVQLEALEEAAADLGLTIISKGVSNEAELQLAADQIATEVDAIYNMTDNMIVAATSMIVNAADKTGIPVFATEDGQIDQGILATESLSYKQLGHEGGRIIADILVNAKKPSDIPVYVTDKTELIVNEAQAKKLNITLPESITQRAVLR